MTASELHKAYTTLVSRGMPEHKFLHWVNGLSCFLRTRHEDPEVCGDGVETSIAEDLIIMHALRWLRSIYGHIIDVEFYGPSNSVVFVACTDDKDEGICSEADTILEAILAATEGAKA